MADKAERVLVGRITIERYLDADGKDLIDTRTDCIDGSPLDQITLLGMLEFAKAGFIEEAREHRGNGDG